MSLVTHKEMTLSRIRSNAKATSLESEKDKQKQVREDLTWISEAVRTRTILSFSNLSRGRREDNEICMTKSQN